jgi:NADP-dependent 3-hydroxy acid dehydrogenase YdfG
MSTTDLAGRTAVITGASSGIGASTARALAARGAQVALLARRQDRLDELAGEIEKAGGSAAGYAVDVTDAKAVIAARERIVADLGRPGIVFNNAGVMLPAPILDHRRDQWKHQIDLNVTALMTTIDVFVDDLVAAARIDGVADLVNTSSIAGENLYPDFAVYSATKAYVTHLSKHLRTELGPKNVRVSAIAPGIVATELQSHVTDAGAQQWLDEAARTVDFLEPGDIAQTVAFTVSLPARVNLERIVILPTRQAS